MEKIEPRHREKAAAELGALYNTDKIKIVIESILAGQADEHPSVQAAAFYEKKD